MRVKIQLDTITDIGNFVVAVSQAVGKKDKVWVKDNEGSNPFGGDGQKVDISTDDLPF